MGAQETPRKEMPKKPEEVSYLTLNNYGRRTSKETKVFLAFRVLMYDCCLQRAIFRWNLFLLFPSADWRCWAFSWKRKYYIRKNARRYLVGDVPAASSKSTTTCKTENHAEGWAGCSRETLTRQSSTDCSLSIHQINQLLDCAILKEVDLL